MPLLSGTGLPRGPEESEKVTVPVGVPVPDVGATVALSITGPLDPAIKEVGEKVIVVVVVFPMVRSTAADVAAAKLVSPLYFAVIG